MKRKKKTQKAEAQVKPKGARVEVVARWVADVKQYLIRTFSRNGRQVASDETLRRRDYAIAKATKIALEKGYPLYVEGEPWPL